MSPVPASEIPTISLLYHLKKLDPADRYIRDQKPAASQSFNDRIGLIRGDITNLEVDAIVNAANNSLLGGGGVDGAIHRAAGRELVKECRKLDGCDTGSAKITGAYNLPCKKVIHAVGPVYNSSFIDESEEDLRGCYTTSLELAVQNDCKSIAFSALSTGIYGYPSSAAAPVAIKAVKDFLEGPDGDKLELVVFCTFVQKDVDAYDLWLPRFFPSTEPEDTDENVDETMEETKEEAKDGEAKDGEAKVESEWEEVEGGESADNGPVIKEDNTAKEDVPEVQAKEAEVEKTDDKPDTEILPDAPATEPLVVLPDVPSTEPADEGPSPKKQKSDDK